MNNQLDPNKINTIIMQQAGLEVNDDGTIIDQDTGIGLSINGNPIVKGARTKHSIEFDPYNNRKLMNQLFAYFLNKRSEEGELGVSSYYNVDGDSKTGAIECRMEDNQYIRSDFYKRDSLKLADIMMRLNGDDDALDSLKEFDVPLVVEPKSTVKGKKGTKKNAEK